MNQLLKVSLAMFALAGLATTLTPSASAWTCVGAGPIGGEVAQACNDAHDTANWAINQIENCLPDYFRWTCYHYP